MLPKRAHNFKVKPPDIKYWSMYFEKFWNNESRILISPCLRCRPDEQTGRGANTRVTSQWLNKRIISDKNKTHTIEAFLITLEWRSQGLGDVLDVSSKRTKDSSDSSSDYVYSALAIIRASVSRRFSSVSQICKKWVYPGNECIPNAQQEKWVYPGYTKNTVS